MNFKGLILAILLCIKITIAAFEIDSHIDEEVINRINLGYNRAIAIAFVDCEEIILSCVGTDVSENSIFEMGGTTSVLTTHLLLLLEEEGSLSLDEPVFNYLSEDLKYFEKNGHHITLRDLLTHKSGLVDPKDDYYFNPYTGNITPLDDFTIEKLDHYLCSLPDLPLINNCVFSNLNYSLLGYIVESITNKKYEELLKEKIFDPLEMKSTYIDVPISCFQLYLRGTSNGEDVSRYSSHFPAYGGLRTSIHDLSIYLWHLFVDNSFSNIKAKILEVYKCPNCEDLAMSYTFSGTTQGFSSFIGYNSVRNRIVGVLADSDTIANLGQFCLDPSLSLLPLYNEMEVSQEILNSYCGNYSQNLGTIDFTIWSNEGRLYLRGHNGKSMTMYPKNESHFFLKYLDEFTGLIKFTSSSGKIYATIDGIIAPYFLQ